MSKYNVPSTLPERRELYKDKGKGFFKILLKKHKKKIAIAATILVLGGGGGFGVKKYFDMKQKKMQELYDKEMAKLPQYTPEEIDRVIKKVRPSPEDPKFGWKVVKVQTITDKYYLRRVEKFYKKYFGKEIKIRRTFIPTIGRPDGTILGTMSDVLETESGELIYPWR